MSDIKYLSTKEDMKSYLESSNPNVVISKSLTPEEKREILDKNNISTIKLYDKDENETGEIYIRTSYFYGATGGSKLGARLTSASEDDENITFEDTEYGILSYGKNRYDAERHAQAILEQLGYEVDQDKLRETDFYQNYLNNVMNELEHTAKGNIPMYYKNSPSGIKYSIPGGDYNKALRWFNSVGAISEQELVDEKLIIDGRNMRVRCSQWLSVYEMAGELYDAWVQHNNYNGSIPSKEAVVNAFETMYIDVSQAWASGSLDVNMIKWVENERGGKTLTTLKDDAFPNGFVLYIEGTASNPKDASLPSITLQLDAYRFGRGYNTPYSTFFPDIYHSDDKRFYYLHFTGSSVPILQDNDCATNYVTTRWQFGNGGDYETGRYIDTYDVKHFVNRDLFKYILKPSPNYDSESGYYTNVERGNYISGFYVQTEALPDWYYGDEYMHLGNAMISNINVAVRNGSFNDFNGALKLLESYQPKKPNEPIDDYINRTNPPSENPSVNVDTGEPFKQPVYPVREEPINPTYIPDDGVDTTVGDVEPSNPTPVPDPPSPNPVDPTPTPPIVPVVDVTDNGIFAVYNPTHGEMRSFGGKLWSNNAVEILKTVWQNPMEGILSLQSIYVTPETGERRDIWCGNWNSEIQSVIVTNQFVELDCGSINLFEHYGDARDYAPYTDISLFLPFIGFVDLDVYEVMGGIIRVKYMVDVLTGCCLANIISVRDGVEKTLYTYNGNCSVQLPLTSADKSQIVTGAISGAISGGKTGSAVGALAGGAGAGIGAAAGAVLGGAWGGFTGGVSIHRSGEMGANVGALGIKKPYLIVKRYIAFSASGYGGLLGYADNYRCRVGDVSGYSVFTNPVVNVNATASELDEIMEYLTTGVIV